MSKDLEKFLPLEFKSGNEIPVSSVLVSREKMLKIIEEVVDSVEEEFRKTVELIKEDLDE